MPDAKRVVRSDPFLIVAANRDPKLAAIVNTNWATLDGQWPYVLAKWRSQRRDLEKISGSDFVYELCALASSRDYRVFLLGAEATVNRAACSRLHREFGITVDGYSPPVMNYPFPEPADAEILHRLEDLRPDILVIAFGAPKQEFWADAHLAQLRNLGVRWVIGAGGTLDFIAGTVRRAPVLLQRAGMEWLWRLALQPKLRFRRLLRAVQFIQYA
jgi:N-acetylglucosaminyldiphosphoundecaprenol N-acetyl-beta-D-mannosaminyltransferase